MKESVYVNVEFDINFYVVLLTRKRERERERERGEERK